MKKNWLKGVVAAAGMLLATSAYADVLKIGVAGPFTGPNAAFGAQMQKGAAPKRRWQLPEQVCINNVTKSSTVKRARLSVYQEAGAL